MVSWNKNRLAGGIQMKIYDALYGEYQIDGVLEDLVNCPEIQRLKDIHMIGPSYLLNPLWNETRYEHSVGVMLLIKKLGGTIEEQIAGLLHDVSHTIFSHVIDMVMKKEMEDYHEEIKADYLKNSTIPNQI
jgi:HD superfamily phosphohydrolase